MALKLALVDGSSYIFRAYHALPALTRKSDGFPVGAISGFCNMVYKLINDEAHTRDITHLAVIFDASGPSFRNDIYPEYKAHRPPAPEDLVPQFDLIRKATEAFSIPAIEQSGFEADDIIATYTKTATAAGYDVIIIASDKDLMQLVRPGVSMFDSMKDKLIEREQVIEKFGVPPEQVIDVQALAGDSVDNVPGVPGIGIKTAASLIQEKGSLDNLLASADTISQTKRRERLITFADQARVSRDLVRLKPDVPGLPALETLELQPKDSVKLIAFLKAMEFSTLTKRVAEADKIILGDIKADETLAVSQDKRSGIEQTTSENDSAAFTPQHFAAQQAETIAALTIDRAAYEKITTKERLSAWIDLALEQAVIGFDTETDSLNRMTAGLIGLSLAIAPGRACYIPLGHQTGEGLFDDKQSAQLSESDVLAALKPLLEHEAILKVAHNMKFDYEIMRQRGIHIGPYDDTLLISYVTDAGRHGHGMDELSRLWLDHEPITFKALTSEQKGAKNFALVDIDQATAYAAEDADVTLRLWHILKPRLAALKLTALYETLERPMVTTLANMEAHGIQVDRNLLARLSQTMASIMDSEAQEALALAGTPFNLASPKQLGDILFGTLGLPGGKKTKTGAWSTGADTLERLANEGHELPKKILSWRQMAKLKSTYADTLPQAINTKTGRIHTSYALASTSTGRLSSSEPNLQNIPIRTAEGRKIRQAFVAPPGKRLISADYSQIELRLLAHIANIDALKQAFTEGLDIHAMTASEMFGVPIKGMDPMVRRQAKAINFGIIYGISAFGLAAQLGINRHDAKLYMDRYFERFPGIVDYMNQTKAEVTEKGYVTTIFGRRAHYPGIHSKNPAERAFVERAAINAPIQGSAADIIRRAMVRLDQSLPNILPTVKMLLQVHDELVFEVDEADLDTAMGHIRRHMSQADQPDHMLSVPLTVDINHGSNWDEAH